MLRSSAALLSATRRAGRRALKGEPHRAKLAIQQMNRRRKCLVVASGLVLLAMATLLPLWLSAEPRYSGKSLSEWIEYGVTSNEAADQAQQAICEMDALPCLLSWLQRRESKIQDKLNQLLDRQSWIDFRFAAPWQRQALAIAGFAYLGERAAPGIPTLVGLLPAHHIGPSALQSLSYIGEPAVPSILALCDPPDSSVIESLGSLPIRNHPRVVQRLVELARSADPEVQCAALRVLAHVQTQPGVVGPLLAEAATDSQHPARSSALNSLHQWSTNTVLTLPVFLAGLGDANAEIRHSAMDGLALTRPDNLVEILEGCGQAEDRYVRAKAAATLGRCTNRVERAARSLRAAGSDSDPVVRAAAAGALLMLGAIGREETTLGSWSTEDLQELSNIDDEAAVALGGQSWMLSACGGVGNWYVPERIVNARFAVWGQE